MSLHALALRRGLKATEKGSKTTPSAPDWNNPHFSLVGTNGNAYAVIAAVARALKKADNPKSVIDAFTEEAYNSADYNELLTTAMRYSGMLTPDFELEDDEDYTDAHC